MGIKTRTVFVAPAPFSLRAYNTGWTGRLSSRPACFYSPKARSSTSPTVRPWAAARAFSNIFHEYANCFETVEFAVFTQNWESPNYQAFAQMEGIKEAGQE